MSIPKKSNARSQLFSMFLDRLKEDTSLLEQYGGNFEEASHSINYATAVRYEMLKAENNERLKQQVPSAHTIMRWLQRGGFSTQVQSRCVLAVSRFLGFEHFEDYQKSIVVDNDVLEKVSLITTSANSSKLSPKQGIWWGILGGILVTVLTYGFVIAVSKAKVDAAPPSELAVKSLIERANAFEYNLYAQIGRQSLDTSGKHLFFTQDAPAWNTIDKVVQGSIEQDYVLNVDRSNRALVSVEIKRVTDTTILVESLEAWTILWDSKIAVDTRYDEVNEQLYMLKKENDRWKIHQNAYEGKYEVTE